MIYLEPEHIRDALVEHFLDNPSVEIDGVKFPTVAGWEEDSDSMWFCIRNGECYRIRVERD